MPKPSGAGCSQVQKCRKKWGKMQYHWYDFENLKNDLCINDSTKALKEIISSIKDINKVVTIVTFHI